MRFSSSLLALVAVSFSGTSLAASLSDFQPSVNNLPGNCQTVYTAAISGCSGADFGGKCSPACIKGLQSMTSFVQMACTGINFQNQNLISVFLSGMGPASLCPNLGASSGNNSPTTTSQKTTTSAATTSPSTASTGSTQSTASTNSSNQTTSSSPSATSTATSSTKTSPTTTSAGQTNVQTSPTASPPASAQSQCTSRGGGGSPFDIQGTQCSSASSLTTWTGTTMLLAALIVLVVL
ncbi:uncharacterized protein K489DRAFT_3787 [Dissoconium aciculare CBS 342.82]|uniref:Extracellular membrane protein CFEM domain-containing protein n=1 Tax=Dissoconium aciculare CBS 342.82 TaxID=1314786 RepID=A0A6J3MGA6_9PEZI|nr:uncharacterized protein K489DRAFT_3787 [Dissoconium aciculare CBS 342.82]KAF1827001.1 hypothetical protein K489DRAFT_3787 [Dissoconium aciculare CBS 342.82]